MVTIRRFKRRLDLDVKLLRYRDIWSIQSEVEPGAVYCISDGQFAILCWDGAVSCRMEDIEELIDMMRPEIQKEITEVLEMWR